jgi:hypothetical protein
MRRFEGLPGRHWRTGGIGPKIGLPECVAALDAALANLVPDLTPEQLPRIQAALLANRQAVMEELEQRAGS